MANEVANETPDGMKKCIACRELIPADATICYHCQTRQTPEPPAKPDRVKPVMAWVGYTSAVIGLGATLLGGLRWLQTHHQENSATTTQIAIAENQRQRGEYETAFHTYQAILKSDPQNRKAVDGQVDAAMLWLDDFHVVGAPDNDKTIPPQASAKLDEIFPVLDAALVRATGSRKADIQAHIGWAHWLNQKIAEREFGSADEQNLQAALAIDPTNVYANAMLGNMLLQTSHDTKTALAHFHTAEKTGKERALVRAMELGAMIYDEDPGIRAAVVRVVNDMRKNQEAIDEDNWSRIYSYCYSPVVTSRAELVESLSAVPEEESWATYQWIAGHLAAHQKSSLTNDFIYANLLEVSGKKPEALAKFRALQQQLKDEDSWTMHTRVAEAVKRLS
jgi:tetratricopeptide (TPR) repeat protein